MHSGLNPFARQKSDKLPNMTATFHFKSGWWRAVLSVSFWHLKLKVVEDRIQVQVYFFKRLICLLCYTTLYIYWLEEKFHTNWEQQREKIEFCCTFLSIFVTVFLDSLSPVDAILTLGGRYSLPAHMLSHGRKNTSKKNKELCSF